MLQRIEVLLAKPRAPYWLGLAAVLLCLPVLPLGLQADDHFLRKNSEDGLPPWSFFELDPAAVGPGQERGNLVWWSSPQLEIKFFRPLASLSHALEFSLWPHATWAMHLVNVLLYGASVTLAALLYRRLAPSASIAALAALLFAIDDGHAFATSWIASRNTVLSLLFSLLALLLHVRARELGKRWLRVASTASVALALLSAEAGLWALTLLLSYVLVLETGSLRARLRGIAGPLAIGALWASIYLGFGFGMRHSSFYRDPSAPFVLLSQGLLDLPIWFADLTGPGGFPFSLLYPAVWVRLAALPIALGLLWLLLPALRSSRECRFFACAALLCLAPLLACAQPNARVLLGPSFGALGWIACAISAARAAGAAHGRLRAGVLLTLHLALAGLLFVPALLTVQSLGYGTELLLGEVEPGADVVLVQAPAELLSNYVLVITNLRERIASAPHTLQQLYGGASELWVERIDARTLELEVAHGWGYVPIERVFGPVADMPRVGGEVRRESFRVQVLGSTPDGRPQRVRFVFPTPLEARPRKWLTWQGNRPVPWRPPRVGERVHIAPRPFFVALSP